MKVKPVVFVIFICFTLCSTLPSYAEGPVRLPAPKMEGGKPLMQALKDRMTTRAFSEEKLSMQTLSNLYCPRPEGDTA